MAKSGWGRRGKGVMARTKSSSLAVSPANPHLLIPSSSSQWEEKKGPAHDRPMAAAGAWDFRLRSVVAPAAAREASDAIGAMEFDPAGDFLATGGIARKIRIYKAAPLVPDGCEPAAVLDHAAACSLCICAPAKLSSLRWKPGARAVGAGDYDGVVTEYDLDRAAPVFERDEHGGRRVWSVDYSPSSPHLGASASDDGTAQLWDARGGGTATAILRPAAASVCSVEFDPSAASPLIGVGCADKNAYVYDLRHTASPVAVFRGHRRTVTYVRFAAAGNMVSAGTDGCLRLWSLADSRELRAFVGHRNCRSFVGLGVWRPGPLLACGSETNHIYVYDPRWSEPAWVGAFDSADCFVGGVCWRPPINSDPDTCTLAAGASDGVLRLFSARNN